jgi:hypothetical protein
MQKYAEIRPIPKIKKTVEIRPNPTSSRNPAIHRSIWRIKNYSQHYFDTAGPFRTAAKTRSRASTGQFSEPQNGLSQNGRAPKYSSENGLGQNGKCPNGLNKYFEPKWQIHYFTYRSVYIYIYIYIVIYTKLLSTRKRLRKGRRAGQFSDPQTNTGLHRSNQRSSKPYGLPPVNSLIRAVHSTLLPHTAKELTSIKLASVFPSSGDDLLPGCRYLGSRTQTRKDRELKRGKIARWTRFELEGRVAPANP